MAEGHSMTVAAVVADVLAGEAGDFLRAAVELVARELMEAEISAQIGAARGEVSVERTRDEESAVTADDVVARRTTLAVRGLASAAVVEAVLERLGGQRGASEPAGLGRALQA